MRFWIGLVATMGLLSAATFEQKSESGRQRVCLTTTASGIALREFHTWQVGFCSAAASVDAVAFDASMPAHGHGLATQPTIRPAQAGSFAVEGVRFHMAGHWILRVRFHDARGWDSVSIPFQVEFASALLQSLWIGSRKGPRADPTNRFADVPEAAVLGQKLFEDPRLSGDGKVSCATCHMAAAAYADTKRYSLPGLLRNSQGLLGVADATWLFWDGRRDSLWSQALSPIESRVEMNGSRAAAVRLLREQYRPAYEKLAGVMDSDTDRVFANIGKFIAAYERTLVPGGSRFDTYVEKGSGLTADEIAGLNLFVKPESQCINCHNGPLFTNHGFHNIGTAVVDGEHPDFGRAMGVQALAYDTFNCRSIFSDDSSHCAALEHALTGDHDGRMMGAFKTPTLRNVALTAPYMHDGSLATLADVIEHYRHPRLAEVKPLDITDAQARQLVAFLRALTDVDYLRMQ